MSKLHFLWTKIYFNIEMYLWRGDTCHVGTLFELSPRHRFHCICKIAHYVLKILVGFTGNLLDRGYTLSTCVDAKKYIFINDHCDNMESQLIIFVRFPSDAFQM